MPVRETVYKYDSAALKIGPARVFIADYLTSEPPDTISDICSLSTYDAASGWTSLGDTVEPVVMSHGFDEVEVRTQQHGKVAGYVGDYDNRVRTTFAERSQAVKQAILGVDLTTATNTDSENVTYQTITTQLEHKRLAIMHLDETTTSPFALIVTVFPKVKRSGSASEWNWDRETQQSFPCEWSVYPDKMMEDPTTGEYIYAYDLEQPAP